MHPEPLVLFHIFVSPSSLFECCCHLFFFSSHGVALCAFSPLWFLFAHTQFFISSHLPVSSFTDKLKAYRKFDLLLKYELKRAAS